jgi:hypothetical protein
LEFGSIDEALNIFLTEKKKKLFPWPLTNISMEVNELKDYLVPYYHPHIKSRIVGWLSKQPWIGFVVRHPKNAVVTATATAVLTMTTTTTNLLTQISVPLQMRLGGFWDTEKVGSLQSMRLGNVVVTTNGNGIDQKINININLCTNIIVHLLPL